MALRSPRVRCSRGSSASAASSGWRRHSHDGTPVSRTGLRRTGTPALRKYFCASTSQATCDHVTGTSTSSWRNTTEPSGLRISLHAVRSSTFS